MTSPEQTLAIVRIVAEDWQRKSLDIKAELSINDWLVSKAVYGTIQAITEGIVNALDGYRDQAALSISGEGAAKVRALTGETE